MSAAGPASPRWFRCPVSAVARRHDRLAVPGFTVHDDALPDVRLGDLLDRYAEQRRHYGDAACHPFDAGPVLALHLVFEDAVRPLLKVRVVGGPLYLRRGATVGPADSCADDGPPLARSPVRTVRRAVSSLSDLGHGHTVDGGGSMGPRNRGRSMRSARRVGPTVGPYSARTAPSVAAAVLVGTYGPGEAVCAP